MDTLVLLVFALVPAYLELSKKPPLSVSGTKLRSFFFEEGIALLPIYND